MAVFRQIAQQSVHQGIDRLAIQHLVIVVEDDDEILADLLLDGVDHQPHKGIYVLKGAGIVVEGLKDGFAEIRESLADGGDQVFQKYGHLLIVGIQIVPTDRQVGIVGIVHQQRRLAVAGGRGDQDEAVVDVMMQKADQAFAPEQRTWTARRSNFDFDQGVGSVHHSLPELLITPTIPQLFYHEWRRAATVVIYRPSEGNIG